MDEGTPNEEIVVRQSLTELKADVVNMETILVNISARCCDIKRSLEQENHAIAMKIKEAESALEQADLECIKLNEDASAQRVRSLALENELKLERIRNNKTYLNKKNKVTRLKFVAKARKTFKFSFYRKHRTYCANFRRFMRGDEIIHRNPRRNPRTTKRK